jgi:hypothetical protein
MPSHTGAYDESGDDIPRVAAECRAVERRWCSSTRQARIRRGAVGYRFNVDDTDVRAHGIGPGCLAGGCHGWGWPLTIESSGYRRHPHTAVMCGSGLPRVLPQAALDDLEVLSVDIAMQPESSGTISCGREEMN